MAAVLFAALMTTTVLTSCSSSDSDEPKKPEFTKAVVKYTVNSDDATLGLFKLNVYGTDADGNAVVETMSNPSYSKTVEIPVSKLPCTVEYYIMVTPLEDKVATEDFDVKIERSIDAMSLLSDNTVSGVVEDEFNKYIGLEYSWVISCAKIFYFQESVTVKNYEDLEKGIAQLMDKVKDNVNEFFKVYNEFFDKY